MLSKLKDKEQHKKAGLENTAENKSPFHHFIIASLEVKMIGWCLCFYVSIFKVSVHIVYLSGKWNKICVGLLKFTSRSWN